MGWRNRHASAGSADRPQNSRQKKNDRDSHGFTMHSKAKNYQIVKRFPGLMRHSAPAYYAPAARWRCSSDSFLSKWGCLVQPECLLPLLRVSFVAGQPVGSKGPLENGSCFDNRTAVSRVSIPGKPSPDHLTARGLNEFYLKPCRRRPSGARTSVSSTSVSTGNAVDRCLSHSW